MLFADQSPIVVVGVGGVARLPLPGCSHKALHKLFEDAPLDVNPAGAQADFSLTGDKMGGGGL